MKLAAIVSLVALIACGPALAQQDTATVVYPDGTTAQVRQVPVLIVENNLAQAIYVYDRGFMVAHVAPGASMTTVLPYTGDRALTIRVTGGGPTLTTDHYAFETNRKWKLTIEFDGRAVLNLAA